MGVFDFGLLTVLSGGSTGFIDAMCWPTDAGATELFEAGRGIAEKYPDTIVTWVGEFPVGSGFRE